MFATCVKNLQRPEVGLGCLGAGGTYSYELPNMGPGQGTELISPGKALSTPHG